MMKGNWGVNQKKCRSNFLLLLVWLSCLTFAGDRIANLPEINNPSQIIADSENLYIVDAPTIRIYSIKDFRPLHKFGQRGGGPGEFMFQNGVTAITVAFHGNHLFIQSQNKVSWYTKTGELIKEMRVPPIWFLDLKPLLSSYVGEEFEWEVETKTGYFALWAYDEKFNRMKLISRVKRGNQINRGWKLFAFSKNFEVYNNTLYYYWGTDTMLRKIADGEENPTEIKLDIKRKKISSQFKDKYIEHLKSLENYKSMVSTYGEVSFPKYFPALSDFRVTDGFIYAFTYEKDEDDNKECLVFNLDGKIVKKVFIAFKKGSGSYFYPYTIKNGVIYQVFEDEEEDIWAIFTKTIHKK